MNKKYFVFLGIGTAIILPSFLIKTDTKNLNIMNVDNGMYRLNIYCENCSVSESGKDNYVKKFSKMFQANNEVNCNFKKNDDSFDDPKILNFTVGGSQSSDYSYADNNLAFTIKGNTNIIVKSDIDENETISFDYYNNTSDETVGFNFNGTLSKIDWGDNSTTDELKSSHSFTLSSDIHTVKVYGNISSISFYNEDTNGLIANGNKYIKAIALKGSVDTIPNCALGGLTNLRNLKVGPNVKNINGLIFSSNDQSLTLNSIIVDTKNKIFTSGNNNNNILLNKDTGDLLLGCSKSIISEDVKTIKQYSFINTTINSLELPGNVTKIEPYAFINNESLKMVKFNNDIELGSKAFVGNVFNTIDFSNLTDSNIIIASDSFDLSIPSKPFVFPTDSTLATALKNNLKASGISDSYFAQTPAITILASLPNANLSLGINANGVSSIDYGDGSSGTELTHTYTSEGDYTVKVYGTNITGFNTYYNYSQALKSDKYITSISCTEYVKSLFEDTTEKYYGMGFLTNCKTMDFSKVAHISPNDVVFESCFRANTSLEKIYLPKTVKILNSYVFNNDKKLKSVNIDNVTSIGASAFLNCENLASIEIPSTLTSIGSSCFESCKNLETISFNSTSITNIPVQGFKGCENLSNIELPDTCISFGDNAFNGCSKLTNINFGNIISIGKAAFSNTNIKELSFGSSLSSIGENAFKNCNNVENISVVNNTKYDSRDNCNALIETSSSTLLLASKNTDLTKISSSHPLLGITAGSFSSSPKIVDIPDSVTYLNESCFANNNVIEEVSIPANSITEIPVSCFQNCKNLKKVVFKNSSNSTITSIGNYAFQNCSSLQDIVLPDSISTIGLYGFAYCSSLVKFKCPNALTEIKSYTFYDCSSLEEIELAPNVDLSKLNVTTAAYIFYHCDKLNKISGTVKSGFTLANSCVTNSNNEVVLTASNNIPQNATKFLVNSFVGDIKEVIIPSAVTSIANGSFKFLSSVEKFTSNSSDFAFDTKTNCLYATASSTYILSATALTEEIPNDSTFTSTRQFSFTSKNIKKLNTLKSAFKISMADTLLGLHQLETLNLNLFTQAQVPGSGLISDCPCLKKAIINCGTKVTGTGALLASGCDKIEELTVNGLSTTFNNKAFFTSPLPNLKKLFLNTRGSIDYTSAGDVCCYGDNTEIYVPSEYYNNFKNSLAYTDDFKSRMIAL